MTITENNNDCKRPASLPKANAAKKLCTPKIRRGQRERSRSSRLCLKGLLLEKYWFASLFSPYLSFGDMRSLSMSNKTAKCIVSSVTSAWPEEIKELVRTWCTEQSGCPLVVGIPYHCIRIHEGVVQHRRSAPIIQFQLDCLSYDTKTGKLRGEPWSEVIANNQQPKNLGRGSFCFANDAKTQIFVCGGESLAGDDDIILCGGERYSRNKRSDDNEDWWPLDRADSDMVETTVAALFDLETRLWTELRSNEFASIEDSEIFRVGKKIFHISGDDGLIPYFDLETMEWELFFDGYCKYPGEGHRNLETIVVDDNTVVVLAGCDENAETSSEVYSLNMTTGVWTQLPDLPETFIREMGRLDLYSKDNTVFITNGVSWAKLSLGGEWELNPDLRKTGIQVLSICDSACEVLAGNEWIKLPPYNDDFEGNIQVIHIDEMQISWMLMNKKWVAGEA